MDIARLEKLNAYLISKGKRPKELSKNFVKSNAKSLKKGVTPQLPKPKQVNHVLNKNSNAGNIKRDNVSLASQKLLLSKNLKENRPPVGKSLKTRTVLCNKKVQLQHSEAIMCREKINSTKECPNVFTKSFTPHRSKVIQTPKPKLSEKLTKKLVRRSMNTSLVASQKKMNSLIQPASSKNGSSKRIFTPKSLRSKPSISKSEKIVRTKSIIPMVTGKTPAHKKSATEAERMQRLEQLRIWLISKGKDPTKLCGFKPMKTMLTPINSPAKQDRSTPKKCSQWPSLRDEDYCDALTVLVRQTMGEAKACLQNDCSVNEVYSQLIEFSSTVPIVEKYACYWQTLALVYEKLGRNGNEILGLYEKALEKEAQPVSEIKQAVQNFVSLQISKPEIKPDESKIPLPCIPNMPSVDYPVSNSTKQSEIRGERSLGDANCIPERMIKDQNIESSTVVFSSPSSVVKLRMVPRSSPIFKRLVSRKALPFDVSAIVTPVRRSKRIEESKFLYPKSVRDHDKCVATPLDLLQSTSGHEEAKDFVFDRNKAFGEDYAEIETVLQFS